jgi:hypothetical protein
VAAIDSGVEGCDTATALVSLFDLRPLLAIFADTALCSRAGAHWYSG